MLQACSQPSRGISSSSKHKKASFLDAIWTILDPDPVMKYVAGSKVTIRFNPILNEYGMPIYVC
jgi:hypothetical protein